MKKTIKKIRFSVRELLKNKGDISRLENRDFTIISSDCTGGCILHDLHMKFNSPTVNMYFGASDFIKFCSNMKSYLNGEITSLSYNDYEYPVALLTGAGGVYR